MCNVNQEFRIHQTSNRYNKYSAFCLEAGISNKEGEAPLTINSNVVRDDEEESTDHHTPKYQPEVKVPKPLLQTQGPGTLCWTFGQHQDVSGLK